MWQKKRQTDRVEHDQKRHTVNVLLIIWEFFLKSSVKKKKIEVFSTNCANQDAQN